MSISINSKGLMYRLAYWGSGFEEYNIPENLCPFVRKMLLGMVFCSFAVIAGAVAGFVLLDPVMTLVMYLITGFFLPYFDQTLLSLGVCFYIIGTVFGSIAFCVFLYHRYEWIRNILSKPRNKVQKAKASSSYRVAAAYAEAWHDKICPKIDIT